MYGNGSLKVVESFACMRGMIRPFCIHRFLCHSAESFSSPAEKILDITDQHHSSLCGDPSEWKQIQLRRFDEEDSSDKPSDRMLFPEKLSCETFCSTADDLFLQRSTALENTIRLKNMGVSIPFACFGGGRSNAGIKLKLEMQR